MSTTTESFFYKTWRLRDQLREVIVEAEEIDVQGYVTSALNRVEKDLTGDLRYLLSKIIDERKGAE